MLEAGIKGYAEEIVDNKKSAKEMESGTLEVYATPCMIRLVEKAACSSLAESLEEGFSSVGTLLNINHLAATPLGMKVWAQTLLTGIEGRKLSFEVQVFDERGLIGDGVHERFVIDVQKFLQKANAKKSC